jgi:hypothetical protein
VVAYTAPANDPKYISIPTINTGTVRVLKLGLLSNGSMSVPGNIYDAGWYSDSVPMNIVLTPTKSANSGLNLMTCAGSIIKGTSEFSERLVVFTSLVNS